MKKRFKTFAAALTAVATVTTIATPVMARDMNIYVSGQKVYRDICQVRGFDMLPILDIAGELGFEAYTMNDSAVRFYNNEMEFVFELGNPSVFNNQNKWIGLDIVPQYINGKFMIPAKFFQDVFGYSYIWDSVTDTLFLNSDYQYNWLINTPEYKNGVAVNTKRDNYSSRLKRIADDLAYDLKNSRYTKEDLAAKIKAADAVDALLNEIYQYLKSTMPAGEFAALEKDEINWIAEKEAALERVKDGRTSGSGLSWDFHTTEYDYTYARCEYLISLIK